MEGKKYPLAFLIHGGPEGAWNDEWGNRWNPQVFAAAGFVGMIFFRMSIVFYVKAMGWIVITVNPTGSTVRYLCFQHAHWINSNK